jgi:hypothetical protein
VRSNTPLAALTALNEPVFVEAARAFAARVIGETKGAGEPVRIDRAYRLCLQRSPRDDEVKVIAGLLAEQRKRMVDGSLRPRAVLGMKESDKAPTGVPETGADDSIVERAAWTIVARVMLNLDETMVKN